MSKKCSGLHDHKRVGGVLFMPQSNFSKMPCGVLFALAVTHWKWVTASHYNWGASLVVILSEDLRPGTHRVVCVYRAGICVCLSSLCWWRWRTRLPLEHKRMLQISYFFNTLRAMYWRPWMTEVLGLRENPRMQRQEGWEIEFSYYPVPTNKVFWRYSHSLLG